MGGWARGNWVVRFKRRSFNTLSASSPLPPPVSRLSFKSPPMPPNSMRFTREHAPQDHKPGFGLGVVRRGGHWLQAAPLITSLQFPAHLFVIALRLRLGLPHPCLTTSVACSCGHPLNTLRTILLRCACAGERTSSHDFVHDAVYHIIRESR